MLAPRDERDSMSHWTMAAARDVLADRFAPWVRALDLTVEALGPQSAILRMRFHDDLCRDGGIVSGQALAALADTAMVFAIASASEGYRAMATIDLHATFMRPVANADVLAEATVERLGRTMAFARVSMRADQADGKKPLVATAVGTFALPA